MPIPPQNQSFQYQSPYQLPASATSVIPQELGQDFLSSLDASFQASDKKKQEDLLGFQQSRGLLNSGDTNQKLVTDVLGPEQDRNKAAITGLATQAAQIGEGQQFQAKQDAQNFQYQLQSMQEQARLSSQLLQLQAQLQVGSINATRPSLLQSIIPAAGAAIGSLAGPVGFAAGGAAGGWLASLFGGGGQKNPASLPSYPGGANYPSNPWNNQPSTPSWNPMAGVPGFGSGNGPGL